MKYKEEKPNLEMTISVEDENGKKIPCEALSIFPVGKRQYIALLPQGSSADDDIWLYRFVPVGTEEFNLEDIESDEEFDRVAAAFEGMVDGAELDTILDELEIE